MPVPDGRGEQVGAVPAPGLGELAGQADAGWGPERPHLGVDGVVVAEGQGADSGIGAVRTDDQVGDQAAASGEVHVHAGSGLVQPVDGGVHGDGDITGAVVQDGGQLAAGG